MLTISTEILRDGFEKYHIHGIPVDAVIHKISNTDSDESIHDHPFSFTSFILKGGYIERTWNLDGAYLDIERKAGQSFKVYSHTIHQIIELFEGECWTLILPERWERKPGFYKFTDKAFHRFWDENEWKEI